MGEAESGGGFYLAVNRKSVRPTKDEVSKNEELAVVKSNGEGELPAVMSKGEYIKRETAQAAEKCRKIERRQKAKKRKKMYVR